MTSFKFPPPPPPPPRAATNDAQPSYSSQRGGPNRGRGGDRGRGGERGRGRGGHTRGGSNFGGQSQGRGNAHGGRGGARGGYQNNHGANAQPQRQPAPSPNMQSSHAASGIQPQHGGQMQSQMDPQAFAQAMSFMSTPAGMQSMNAFANHMSSTTNGVPQYPQSSPVQPVQVAPRFSPGQQAGQKRKRPEHGSNAPPLPQKKPQAGPKPPRAKAAAPPPVPSFGFSLPAPLAQSTADAKHDQRKRKMNLGLSEQNVMEESSEEEEVDEEAAFAEKVKIEGVAFEHNGEMISLQTAADVQSYIKDRRRNFPTRQRAAEKAQEAAAKREHELEFLHRVQGKPRKVATADAPPRPAKPVRQVKEVDKRKQEELAALRKRLHESMTNKQRPPPTNLLGLGYESETDSNAESSVLSDSSVVSSSEESEPGSDEEDSDSDAPPEPTSSKAAPPPVAVPPPAPVAAPPSQVCRNWSKDGRCKFGKGCRWAHPPQDKGSGKSQGTKKMGLFEKMVEQELEKADRLALDAIKYLGQNGFLG